MKRIAAALAAAVLFGCAAIAAESEWKEYSYPDDGFAISAPAEPALETQPIYVVGGTANAHIYTIPAGEKSLFMVFIFERHRADARANKQHHDHAHEGAVRSVRGKLKQRSDVVLGKYRGFATKFEAEHPELDRTTHEVRNRYYAIGRRVYHLMAIAPLGEPFPVDAEKWFDSFRLVSQKTAR